MLFWITNLDTAGSPAVVEVLAALLEACVRGDVELAGALLLSQVLLTGHVLSDAELDATVDPKRGP